MMMFIWLIIGFAIYYAFKNSGSLGSRGNNEKNPVEVLKQRYINGEIDDETYKRMLRLINN